MIHNFIASLQLVPEWFIFLVALFSLLIGSFLNVLIYRLPLMMFREWKSQCQEFLAECPKIIGELPSKYNLISPRSSCPHCLHRISALENIPIVSYCTLRGKCSHCQNPIPIHYPVVEFVTLIASVTIALHFGVTWQLLCALLFTWSLITITLIDCNHQIIPDQISLGMMWIGLLLSLIPIFVGVQDALMGAAVGYLTLWTIAWIGKLILKKQAMGHGDFKLLAMLGAWLGFKMLPQIILISSALGAVIGISWLLVNKKNRHTPIPFGPYLAVAGWVALLWGHDINQYYLDYMFYSQNG